jgi:hypothetical protein
MSRKFKEILIVNKRDSKETAMNKKDSKEAAEEKLEQNIEEKKDIAKMKKDEVIEEVKNAQQQAQEAQAELKRLAQVNKDIQKLNNLRRHINKVQDAILIMAEKLISQDKIDLAKIIVANSMTHDVSKFSGIEWEYLVKEDGQVESYGDKLSMAIYQHVHTNDHHPERWGGIENMPPAAIAEMVCDWYARSSESASNLRDWIKKEATKKYEIKPTGKQYKLIKYFVDLLLDVPLKTIKPMP